MNFIEMPLSEGVGHGSSSHVWLPVRVREPLLAAAAADGSFL